MYSLLIKNATVVDGTGQPGKVLDVAVQDDEIVNIAPKINSSAEVIIDAAGKILSPGFVDLQNHSDSYWQLFDNPQLSSMVTQGYTTILVGNCGASLAPLLSPDALLAIQKWHNLDAVNIDWQSFGEFIKTLSKTRLGCNVGSLVGYSTLRRAVVGDQIRGLEKSEMASLQSALKKSLKAGAFGMSSGLSYSHEIIISELELFDLAKIIAEQKGLFSIHLRSEGAEIIEALGEALEIAHHTGVNLKISHLKIRNQTNWPKYEEAVNLIDTAFHQGTNVHFDVYPYETIWQPLYSYLPKWAIQGGRTLLLKHLSDPTQRNKILMYLSNAEVKYSTMMVASTASKLNFVGKTIGQIAKNLEVSSEQAVLHLIINGGSEILVFEQNLDFSQVKNLLAHPLSFVGTDGAGFGFKEKSRLVHPRCFGTAEKFIKDALVDGKLTIEQIIKKLSDGPAKKIGLKKRGSIAVGNFADLVLLDIDKVAGKATYQNPYQQSAGVDYVFVNGQAVVFQGQATGSLPGYTLRKS